MDDKESRQEMENTLYYNALHAVFAHNEWMTVNNPTGAFLEMSFVRHGVCGAPIAINNNPVPCTNNLPCELHPNQRGMNEDSK